MWLNKEHTIIIIAFDDNSFIALFLMKIYVISDSGLNYDGWFVRVTMTLIRWKITKHNGLWSKKPCRFCHLFCYWYLWSILQISHCKKIRFIPCKYSIACFFCKYFEQLVNVSKLAHCSIVVDYMVCQLRRMDSAKAI